jgi:hypothetical protein
MLETMYAAPGRGLAAPQVGHGLRLFVMDVAWKEGTPQPFICVNPEIVDRSPDRVTGRRRVPVHPRRDCGGSARAMDRAALDHAGG